MVSSPIHYQAHELDDCPICLSAPVDPYQTRCDYVFCRECYDRWEQVNATCPVCRTALDLWDVQGLIGYQRNGNQEYYLVLWTTGEETWEPAENLNQCEHLQRFFQ